jgi:hypothetical protein
VARRSPSAPVPRHGGGVEDMWLFRFARWLGSLVNILV